MNLYPQSRGVLPKVKVSSNLDKVLQSTLKYGVCLEKHGFEKQAHDSYKSIAKQSDYVISYLHTAELFEYVGAKKNFGLKDLNSIYVMITKVPNDDTRKSIRLIKKSASNTYQNLVEPVLMEDKEICDYVYDRLTKNDINE